MGNSSSFSATSSQSSAEHESLRRQPTQPSKSNPSPQTMTKTTTSCRSSKSTTTTRRKDSNLYEETRDMAVASFLVYTFGYVMETARRHPDTFLGLDVNAETGTIRRTFRLRRRRKDPPKPSSLPRVFTPSDVQLLIERNQALLEREFPGSFRDPSRTLHSLALLQRRIDKYHNTTTEPGGSSSNRKTASSSSASSSTPPPLLTLQEYDDKHQRHSPVYAVAVDRINGRVTLAFRGTDNDLAFQSNWKTNVSIAKTSVDKEWPFDTTTNNKSTVQKEYGDVQLHAGFYNYLFRPTHKTDENPHATKFDEIQSVLQPLLNAHPDFALYVTGHSLGGALAVITSFFLAAALKHSKHNNKNSNAQTPTTAAAVTCYTFGAPRVGNRAFLQAVHALERSNHLRCCRVVNDRDSVAALPVVAYHHVGWEVRLYRHNNDDNNGKINPTCTMSAASCLSPPTIAHATATHDSVGTKLERSWRNSLVSSWNVRYDHGEYRERIQANRATLEQCSLPQLYADLWASTKTTTSSTTETTATYNETTMERSSGSAGATTMNNIISQARSWNLVKRTDASFQNKTKTVTIAVPRSSSSKSSRALPLFRNTRSLPATTVLQHRSMEHSKKDAPVLAALTNTTTSARTSGSLKKTSSLRFPFGLSTKFRARSSPIFIEPVDDSSNNDNVMETTFISFGEEGAVELRMIDP